MRKKRERLLLESLEHHTGTAPVPKLWKSLIILLDQWCLKRDRSTDLDRLAFDFADHHVIQRIAVSISCILNIED